MTLGFARAKNAFNDEQAVLARVRYNRLIDIFLGMACYSLQNHFRTTVPNMGQVETDELYVGIDRRGAHYVVPVQAKGGSNALNQVQIEQDIALCAAKLPNLICRPVGVQSMGDGLMALFEFELDEDSVGILAERHYHLVSPNSLSEEELARYRQRLSEEAPTSSP